MPVARLRAYNVGAVHILLATDADWIVDEVTAALGGPDTSFTVCREGRLVSKLVAERTPDLAVLDLQVGFDGRDGDRDGAAARRVGRAARRTSTC